MAKPLVAIVGRPNVGKSTFFNKMAGRRISIVEDIPGVTRDRVYADVEWMGRRFSMVDTGGLDMRSEDVLLSQMRHQAQIAILAQIEHIGTVGFHIDEYEEAVPQQFHLQYIQGVLFWGHLEQP